MNICLLGATGRTGSYLARLALADGHIVQALVRDAGRLSVTNQGLHVIEGNVRDAGDVAKAMAGCDAVVSALGTDGNRTLSVSMPLVVEAMGREGIRRLVTIGTAGILQARSNPALYRFQSAESRRKTTAAAEDHLQAYLQLKQSRLDWTIVCPTHLIDGQASGQYRTERDMLPEDGMAVTVGDTAVFAYQQLLSSQYCCTRVGIAT